MAGHSGSLASGLQRKREFETLIENLRAQYELAGLAVLAVPREGEPECCCVGLGDVGANVEIRPESVFRIASVTKTLTAIGVMQLRDAGAFALDDPVNHYLRGFRVEVPIGCDDVTIRHLLAHTSGIGEIASLAHRSSAR